MEFSKNFSIFQEKNALCLRLRGGGGAPSKPKEEKLDLRKGLLKPEKLEKLSEVISAETAVIDVLLSIVLNVPKTVEEKKKKAEAKAKAKSSGSSKNDKKSKFNELQSFRNISFILASIQSEMLIVIYEYISPIDEFNGERQVFKDNFIDSSSGGIQDQRLFMFLI